MNNQYKWAIEDIYQTVEQWDLDFEKVGKSINFDKYKGKLGDAQTFLECMQEQERVARVFDKLSVYAMILQLNMPRRN